MLFDKPKPRWFCHAECCLVAQLQRRREPGSVSEWLQVGWRWFLIYLLSTFGENAPCFDCVCVCRSVHLLCAVLNHRRAVMFRIHTACNLFEPVGLKYVCVCVLLKRVDRTVSVPISCSFIWDLFFTLPPSRAPPYECVRVTNTLETKKERYLRIKKLHQSIIRQHKFHKFHPHFKHLT